MAATHDDIGDTPQPAIDQAGRRRALAALERALQTMLAGLSRDHQRCGKAACARSRRCRGTACEPDREDGET
jgi:hypothetical protein